MPSRWRSPACFGFVLVFGTACPGAPAPTVSPDPAGTATDDPIPQSGLDPEPRRPDAELQALDQCSARMISILGHPASERARGAAENRDGLEQCAELFFSRCDPPSADSDDLATRTQATFHTCLERYCPRWTGDARPRLCDESSLSAIASSDREAARAHAHAFIAAMLAADYGRPASDATLERVAGHFAALWTMSADATITTLPSTDAEPPLDPLGLHVELSTTRVLVLTGDGIEPIELPPGDLDGLRREVEALKQRHPKASLVTIAPDEDVDMEALLQVMGVLQGECSGGESDPRCLFPRVVLMMKE